MALNSGTYFHPEARADLVEIWSYSFERWGKAQADRYVGELRLRVEALPDNPKLGRLWRWKKSETRVLVVRSHVIAYAVTDSQIEVIRILNARQNWQAILGG
jgi:toxin ParE1/3/4